MNKEYEVHKFGKLKINTFKLSNPKSKTIVVGNAYGIMPYIEPLCLKLRERNIQPFWFAFSGQEGIEGEYSKNQCVDDLSSVVEFVSEYDSRSQKINFLSHCAGSLMTLEYLKNSTDTDIRKIIIYGLLFTMNRRRKKAEKLLKICGVKYSLSEEDWNYTPLEALKKCSQQILFCHAKDSLNLERATEEEMQLALRSNTENKIKWFDEGYDKNINRIENFIDTYDSHLSN